MNVNALEGFESDARFVQQNEHLSRSPGWLSGGRPIDRLTAFPLHRIGPVHPLIDVGLFVTFDGRGNDAPWWGTAADRRHSPLRCTRKYQSANNNAMTFHLANARVKHANPAVPLRRNQSDCDRTIKLWTNPSLVFSKQTTLLNE
ncbi:hypothetical protein J6590_042085 [Homalodisca vitripennis]|nr:hypothetical protein J6590_042085 [Homalodisca vitripennis]